MIPVEHSPLFFHSPELISVISAAGFSAFDNCTILISKSQERDKKQEAGRSQFTIEGNPDFPKQS